MRNYSLSDLIRAYFRAGFPHAAPGELEFDPLPEDGGNPAQELVDMGIGRLEELIIESVSEQDSIYQFLKILISKNVYLIMVTGLPFDISRIIFSRMISLGFGHPLIHLHYANWIIMYYRDNNEVLAKAVWHYELAAQFSCDVANDCREGADELKKEIISSWPKVANDLLESARLEVMSGRGI